MTAWLRPRVHGRALLLGAGLPLLLLTAGGLRALLSSRSPLWADELFSLAIATGHSLEHPEHDADERQGDYLESSRPEPATHYGRYLQHDEPPAGIGRIVRAAFLSDTNPPLYYVLVSVWTRAFGTRDGALRWFSILASLACLPLLFALARRCGHARAAFPAVVLFGVLPVCVYYSTEGRMYSLVWFWTSALLLLTLRLRTTRHPALLLSAWVATGTFGLLTHYFFAPVWATVVAWIFAHPGRRARRPLALAVLGTVVLVLPWYWFLPESFGRWRVTGHWLRMPSGVNPLTAGALLPWSFFALRPSPRLVDAWDWLQLGGFAALFTVAAWRLRERLWTSRGQLLWGCLVASLATPPLLDVLLGTHMTSVPRYALAGLPAAYLLAGAMLTSLRPGARAALLLAVVGLACAAVRRLGGEGARNGEPFDRLGQLLTMETRDSDVIVVHSIPSGVCGVARYMTFAGASDRSAPLASWVGRLRERELPGDLEPLASGRRRIALVKVHTVGEPAPQETWLRQSARLVRRRRLQASEVLFFEPRYERTFFAPPGPPTVVGHPPGDAADSRR